MTISQVTNLGVQTMLVNTLQQQSSQLSDLTAQLSSQQQHSDLTDYDPSDARDILTIQNTATQKQAYINVINTVSTKLSVYDTTMTDMESIVAQAQALANQNPSYDPNTAANVGIQATNYLKSIGVDLNQQLNGQYIYSGTRYSVAPTGDLSVLPTSTLTSTIYTDGATLPSYDSQYGTAGGATLALSSGNSVITVGGTITPGQVLTVTVGGVPTSYTIQTGDTAQSIANEFAVQLGGTYGTGDDFFTMPVGTPADSVSSGSSSAAAYTTETATVDTGNTLDYGVSSDNPAFQQLIAGLRYLQKAGSDTDNTTYQTDIQQASTLLTSALGSIQSLHTSVAYNINTLATEKTNQQAAITTLTNQLSDIQSVDITQVSAQITSLETILQASYMVTGDIEKLSIVSYL